MVSGQLQKLNAVLPSPGVAHATVCVVTAVHYWFRSCGSGLQCGARDGAQVGGQPFGVGGVPFLGLASRRGPVGQRASSAFHNLPNCPFNLCGT